MTTTEAKVLTWRATNTPPGMDYNDVFFVTPEQGWTVNINEWILATGDGGRTWTQQFPTGFHIPESETNVRCLAFASPQRGWAGTLTGQPGDRKTRLLETTDGGKKWRDVRDLPENAPKGICGIWAVDEKIVVAAGNNLPFGYEENPPAVMRTENGGAKWTAKDMREHASCLIDVYFPKSERGRKGWVVGAWSDPDKDRGPKGRDNLKPVVLFTEDGGKTWTDQAKKFRGEWPHGEWGWKIQFLNDDLGYISLMSFTGKPGALLKTLDGGRSWRRLPVSDPPGTDWVKAVGFVDANYGWIGGAGETHSGESALTTDGGATWKADPIGTRINQFRFLRNPDGSVEVGYAAGTNVYKYADHSGRTEEEPAAPPPGATLITDEITAARDGRRVDIPIVVPTGTSVVHVGTWDEFGFLQEVIFEEAEPAEGPRTITWDTSEVSGRYVVRVTTDNDSDSRPVSI